MTDAQAGFGRQSQYAPDEILPDQGAGLEIPVLVSALAARGCITQIQLIAICRGAVGRDQKRRTPAIVGDVANSAPHVSLPKPVLALAERQRAQISARHLGAVDRDALDTGLDI